NKNYNTHPLLFVFSLVAWTSIFSQSADIILTNGKIFTSDTTQLYVQALAIKGNKILAAGSSDDMKRFTSSKTIKINLEEKTVVPGFNEAHDHLGSNEFTHVGQMYSAP